MNSLKHDSTRRKPSIHLRSEHPQGRYALRVLRRREEDFLAALEEEGELSILLGTDEAIQEANREWRNKDQPTDVLAFPVSEEFDFELEDEAPMLGDVLISLDTARRQAKEKGHTLATELARLLAHGLLHLLGHDHNNPEEASKMALAEIELLGAAGLVAQALELSPAQVEIVKEKRRKPAASPK